MAPKFVLLLFTFAAALVLEVAPASYGRAPREDFGERKRRQTSGSNEMAPRVASPCPDVLTNIRLIPERSRWFGVLSLTTNETTTGVILTIQLDKPADLVGTSFAEVYSNDNIVHTIRDDNMMLEADELVSVKFFVKYDSKDPQPPSVRTITYNGRLICPSEGGPAVEAVTPVAPTQPSLFTTTSSATTTEPPRIETQPTTVRAIPTTQRIKTMRFTSKSPPMSTLRPSRRPTGGYNLKNVEPYDIDGEFKLKSNGSLVILILAKPPGEESSTEPQDNLEDLLTQVFGEPDEFDEGGMIQAQGLRPLDAGRGEAAEFPEEEDPPFTSSRSDEIAGPGRPSRGDASSPCPGVFTYLDDSAGGDTWHGRLTLTSGEDLVGIWLDVELDKPSRVLGAWLGEAKSTDNMRYQVWNPAAQIGSGETIEVKISVKYDQDVVEAPRIRSIRLNGKLICPKEYS